MIKYGKKLTKNQHPKFKKIFRASRHAERAGILDAVLSSGARSAPELGTASTPPNKKMSDPESGPRIFKKMHLAPTRLRNISYYRSQGSSEESCVVAAVEPWRLPVLQGWT